MKVSGLLRQTPGGKSFVILIDGLTPRRDRQNATGPLEPFSGPRMWVAWSPQHENGYLVEATAGDDAAASTSM